MVKNKQTNKPQQTRQTLSSQRKSLVTADTEIHYKDFTDHSKQRNSKAIVVKL